MTLHHAYLIKGWLLDKDPPKAVTEALEAIIGGMPPPLAVKLVPHEEVLTLHSKTSTVVDQLPERDATRLDARFANGPASADTHPEPKPRKGAGWSPEQRAAAAERLRQRQANGGMRPKQQEPTPGEAPAPSPELASGATSQTW